jgi:hypothetical protein
MQRCCVPQDVVFLGRRRTPELTQPGGIQRMILQSVRPAKPLPVLIARHYLTDLQIIIMEQIKKRIPALVW